MAVLTRPDGIQIHWDATGAGPGVLLCNTFNVQPLDALVAQLADSRRVVGYDPRGIGLSTQRGPYDLATGVADLEALLEQAGPVEVALGIGDGAHRAMRVADVRPDLLERVVFTSTAIGREPGAEGAGFSGSTQVLSALMTLMRRDYRSGLHQMMAGSAHDPGRERERVEEMTVTVPQEAAVAYLEAWVAADSYDVARRLGDRLTVLAYPGNTWFPLEVYETVRDQLAEARFELVEEGPMCRPVLAAEVLLRVSSPTTG